MEEPDDEAEDTDSELPALNHVIESYLPSPTPPKKRRKVNVTNPLNKPFKSPFRTPLKPTSRSDSNAQIQASSLSDNGSAAPKSSPISTPSAFSAAQRLIRPPPSISSTSPTKSEIELDKLQKHHTQLLNTLSGLRARLETTTQALEIEASSEDAELEELIKKWRVTSRDAAEEVYVGMKEKVDGMGGWKKWKATQAEGAKGWYDGQEANKRRVEGGDDDDEEEVGKEEKKERRRMERDAEEQAEKEEEEEADEDFTMETMLKSLNIPLDVIGYNQQQQQWNE
ncbi:MAG: hypothetical protein LQ337_001724 [Flavoplaca oasis]|nr:MAG: hypothetical protein LQ337_001724 [Flavoplaca oasis]